MGPLCDTVEGESSKGFEATMVSPYPVKGGGSRSCAVGGGCGGVNALFAFEVFLRFLGLLGAGAGGVGVSIGGLKSGGPRPGPGSL